MKHHSSIAAYLSADQTFCPDCIRMMVAAGHHRTTGGLSTEQLLDLLAQQRGIRREATGTYSSYAFPKPIDVLEIAGGETCNGCGRYLVGSDRQA